MDAACRRLLKSPSIFARLFQWQVCNELLLSTYPKRYFRFPVMRKPVQMMGFCMSFICSNHKCLKLLAASACKKSWGSLPGVSVNSNQSLWTEGMESVDSKRLACMIGPPCSPVWVKLTAIRKPKNMALPACWSSDWTCRHICLISQLPGLTLSDIHPMAPVGWVQ